jgi:phospholipid/cholesterol/gamma-HCH transport system ATP-binding protein
LDPIIAAGIDALIVHIRAALHTTMVVVSHDIESGMRIADRIAIFHKGVLLEIGTPEEIRRSSEPYVRQFLERRPDAPQEKAPLAGLLAR